MNPKQRSIRRPRSPSGNLTTGDLAETKKTLNAVTADFLKVDVETALTFSGMALETDNPEKRERNRSNARKAYDTICRFSKKVQFTREQEIYISEMMVRLKDHLEQL